MLASVPPKYLIGLKRVVLTNSSGLPRKRRRDVTKSRGRKVKIAEARGLYHPKWNNEPAWIEIFVDNTLRSWEASGWLKHVFSAAGEIGDVLFHEIGHHIHFTARPEYREKEDVADIWRVRLRTNYFQIRHPILRAIGYPFRPLARLLGDALSKSLVKKRFISRAECGEYTKWR